MGTQKITGKGMNKVLNKACPYFLERDLKIVISGRTCKRHFGTALSLPDRHIITLSTPALVDDSELADILDTLFHEMAHCLTVEFYHKIFYKGPDRTQEYFDKMSYVPEHGKVFHKFHDELHANFKSYVMKQMKEVA
jgi:hypothetical protein